MEPRAWTKSPDTDKRKSAPVSSSACDGALSSSSRPSSKPAIAARPEIAENLEGFEYLTSRFPHLAISFPDSRSQADWDWAYDHTPPSALNRSAIAARCERSASMRAAIADQ